MKTVCDHEDFEIIHDSKFECPYCQLIDENSDTIKQRRFFKRVEALGSVIIYMEDSCKNEDPCIEAYMSSVEHLTHGLSWVEEISGNDEKELNWFNEIKEKITDHLKSHELEFCWDEFE